MGLRAGEGKGGRGQMGKEPRPLLPCGLHGASQGQGQAAWGGGGKKAEGASWGPGEIGEYAECSPQPLR